MASYGALLRSITTAEVNRVLREGAYTRWAYFVDTRASKVGVIYANDTTFAAYAVDDTPDPKLHRFGQELIKDLTIVSDDERLVLTVSGNQFEAVIFSDPMAVVDDDFQPWLTDEVLVDWQRFLGRSGVRLPGKPILGMKPKVALAVLGVLIMIFLAAAIFVSTRSTGYIAR